MTILKQSYDFLQEKILPQVAKRHRKLFRFGFEALTIRPFVSLNGNSRVTVENRATAQSKIYRLVTQQKILSYFPQLVTGLGLVTEKEMVNVDFSTFGGFQVLTFAKQTQLGRALPLYFNTITYPIESEGSQTIFIEKTIKEFIALLGFTPHLVFDRGFESSYLVPFLVKERIPFIIRFKKDKHILYNLKEIPMRNLPWFEKDCVVEVYENIRLRVVVSEKRSERTDSEEKEEPWYLITNDYKAPKEEIISKYYFRFEIEETFKDLKHINELASFYRIKKEQTFKILLWFCMLAIWLSFLILGTRDYLVKRIREKRCKMLSVTRYLQESIQLELFSFYKAHFF
ncbi:MAG TPA: transposase [Methylomirabilota bacterium]|nr:transposase [Methylomirabilota bacterium]